MHYRSGFTSARSTPRSRIKAMTTKIALVTTVLSIVILVWSTTVFCQETQNASTFKERAVDSVDVLDGAPLPPPQATSTSSKEDIDALCEKLKKLGKAPESCL